MSYIRLRDTDEPWPTLEQCYQNYIKKQKSKEQPHVTESRSEEIHIGGQGDSYSTQHQDQQSQDVQDKEIKGQ